MLPLAQALHQTPIPLLLMISRLRKHPVSSQIPKEALVTYLSQTLLHPDSLQRAMQSLSKPQHHLLHDLLSVAGHLPRRHLQTRYGTFSSARQIVLKQRSLNKDPDAPPLSTIESLMLLGLIFHDQASDRLFIPAELQSQLQTMGPSLISTPPLLVRTNHPPSEVVIEPWLELQHDLTCLLAQLQKQPPRIQHGQWLPPRFLQQWGQQTWQAPTHPQARSERQTPRRRFLHFLAHQAHWLTLSHNRLVLTVQAWHWLQASPADRATQVWQAWQTATPESWQQFQQPGHAWLTHPPYLLQHLHQGIQAYDISTIRRGRPSEASLEAEAFSRWLTLHFPDLIDVVPATYTDPDNLLGETVQALCTGPLLWLGVLQPRPTPTDAQTTAPSPTHYQLSTWGQYWLKLGPEPALSPPTRYELHPTFQPQPLKSTLMLTQTDPFPDPLDQMMAQILSHPQEAESASEATAARSLQVTAASFVAAHHQGWSTEALVQALQRMSQRQLTAQETTLLHAWADAATTVTLHHLPVLETTDPAVIDRLATSRRGRAHIVRTLSNRAVIVDGFKQAALIKRLTAQEGVPPKVSSQQPAKIETTRLPQLPVSSTRPSPAPTHILLALQVYQALGHYIDLPSHLPPGLLDTLRDGLSEGDLAAVETATQQTITALAAALIGRLAFPPWPEAGLPLAESLPLIETALAEGHFLDLHYYALSTDTVTRRIVEPYRLEWRGGDATMQTGTPYLIGFCQRAQAERVFRLDRIRAVAVGSRR